MFSTVFQMASRFPSPNPIALFLDVPFCWYWLILYNPSCVSDRKADYKHLHEIKWMCVGRYVCSMLVAGCVKISCVWGVLKIGKLQTNAVVTEKHPCVNHPQGDFHHLYLQATTHGRVSHFKTKRCFIPPVSYEWPSAFCVTLPASTPQASCTHLSMFSSAFPSPGPMIRKTVPVLQLWMQLTSCPPPCSTGTSWHYVRGSPGAEGGSVCSRAGAISQPESFEQQMQ